MRTRLLIITGFLLLSGVLQQGYAQQTDPPSDPPAEEEAVDPPTEEDPPTDPPDEEPDAEDPAEREEEDPELEGLETFEQVAIWPDLRSPGFETVDTDSTLRWFMGLNWTERLHRMPGVNTYRTGQLGHPDGVDIDGWETRHLRLRVNEMDRTDPVTGQVNWNLIPYHKIRTVKTDPAGALHHTHVTLREHYMTEPRTYLNFDEGGGDYRNLEFAFTRNFREDTNIELSFWDRRDGNRFPQTGLEGRQIVVRGRHHLSDTRLLKAGYINNGLDLDQSFGYQIPDPEFYDFNPFNAIALEPDASSNQTTNDLYLQMYERADPETDPERSVGLQYQTDRRSLEYSQDTTAYAMRDLHLYGWQEWRPGSLTLRGRGSVHRLAEARGESMPQQGYWMWDGELRGEWELLPGVTVRSTAAYRGRGDGHDGYDLVGSLVLRPLTNVRMEASAGLSSMIPTLQALYWQSLEYSGNEALSNETAEQARGEVRWRFIEPLELGVAAGVRFTGDGIFVDPDSTFRNIARYRTRFGSAWLDLDSERFEGSVSITARQRVSSAGDLVNRMLDQTGPQTLVRGSLYWKNEVFSRAAFVKAGLAGFWNPGGYHPAGYQVPLNRWQHGVENQIIMPEHHRLDAEVSARVRWFMVLLRYENILDGVDQRGYFETGGYPMPGRRFLAGFRIVFTN